MSDFGTTVTDRHGNGASAPSDNLAQRVLDAVRDHAMFALDEEGHILTWNAAAQAITGYSADEALYQRLTLLSARDSESDMERLLQGVRNSGVTYRERWWRRRDGSLVWIDEQIQPLGEEGFVVVAQDLTARIEAEERLLSEWSRGDASRRQEREALERQEEGRRREAAGREREQAALERERLLRTELQAAERRAAFLAEASSILVATSLDFDSTLRALTRLAVSRISDWCTIHAYDDADQLRLAGVAHRDPRLEAELDAVAQLGLSSDWENAVESVINTGQSQILGRITSVDWFGFGGEDADSAARFGLGAAMITPLMGRGRVLGAITLVATEHERDYDEEDLLLAEELGRRAAIALDNARLFQEAQEASRAKGDFLAVMSHELRTPLNAIMGYSDLLDAQVSGELTERQRKQLDRIRASARHLLQLIEEILSYARMESGGEEVRVEAVPLGELLTDVRETVEPMAAHGGLEFRIEVPDQEPTLRTDYGKLRQVLLNLLSNAVKFTESGRVTLRVRVDDDDVHFDVMDTGIGIPAEQLERIFDPFWQVERPNTRRVGGTGLGLSVSRRYIRLLRGDIRVTSEVGRGACFTVSLPMDMPVIRI